MSSAIIRNRWQFGAILHGLGCAIGLIVLLALPAMLLVHHSHPGFRTPEVQREAARHTFAAESDAGITTQLVRSILQHPLVAAAPVCARVVTNGYPIAIATPRVPRLFRRLKLPPPGSLDPFQHDLV
jgi:hypothetical protein